jgi:putative FmdB family regulatory protein
MDSSPQEKASNRLHMAAAQPAARTERGAIGPSHRGTDSGISDSRIRNLRIWNLRTFHKLILMETDLELPMPIFEYICKECHHQFETLLYGKEKAECPKCHATKLEPQLSVFAVSAKGSAPSASPAGACGSCGDPRGPGACSLGDMN